MPDEIQFVYDCSINLLEILLMKLKKLLPKALKIATHKRGILQMLCIEIEQYNPSDKSLNSLGE